MNTKEKIIQQAIALFNENGFDLVNLLDIARSLNKSRGNLAYHFPDKESLLEAISKKLEADIALELQKAKDSLHSKEEAAKVEDEAKSVDSPDTMSTGIKIEPPAVEKLDEEAAVEDGWDDDW